MGPLEGIKILEFGGIGAIPFCGQMLADMGATLLRIERKGGPKARLGKAKFNVWFRNRPAIYIDFKNKQGREAIFKLIESADGTIEGFRPGVMERLGIGPDDCRQRNPKLIYGRLTGYGREGPLCMAAGHDINYLAISGGLGAIGHKESRPVPPLNLLADLGGGGLMLAFGMVCALLERSKSGKGQVVDAAMVDGCTALFGAFYGWWAANVWKDSRGVNLFDSGAPFYDTYQTADGKYIALGALEPEFFQTVLQRLGIDGAMFEDHTDETHWPALKERLRSAFKARTRDEWCFIMEGFDTCFAPVLSFSEAIHHPHNIARNTFVEIGGVTQPAPAPRFSRTQPEIKQPPTEPGENLEESLSQWGFSRSEIMEFL